MAFTGQLVTLIAVLVPVARDFPAPAPATGSRARAAEFRPQLPSAQGRQVDALLQVMFACASAGVGPQLLF
jgi:hypothetical protein